MKASQKGGNRGILIGGFVGLLILALGVVIMGRATPGTISAANITHDFGEVPMSEGVVTTAFPITVEGNVRITELSTT